MRRLEKDRANSETWNSERRGKNSWRIPDSWRPILEEILG